jgi:hypothetical protein
MDRRLEPIFPKIILAAKAAGFTVSDIQQIEHESLTMSYSRDGVNRFEEARKIYTSARGRLDFTNACRMAEEAEKADKKVLKAAIHAACPELEKTSYGKFHRLICHCVEHQNKLCEVAPGIVMHNIPNNNTGGGE